MSLNCRKTWLAGWLLGFLLAAPAWSQGLQDAQLFAPAEVGQFGGGPRPNEGLFFSFDYLRWTIEAPEKTSVGNHGLTREVWYDPYRSTIQSNTLDTGFLSADWTDGQRIEFGDIQGHHGWLFSSFRLNKQHQFDTFTGVDMVFDDKEYGPYGNKHLEGVVFKWMGYDGSEMVYDPGPIEDYPPIKDLPVTFDTVRVDNEVETWGVEWNYLLRLHPNHYGGIFEVFLGARYLEFDEQFRVDARGQRFEIDDHDPPSIIGTRSVLADSFWTTDAENHIVGPQLGVRYFKQNGRWTFSTEGRFLAGFNQQNLRNRGTLGTKLNDPWPYMDIIEDLDQEWAYPYDAPNYPFVPLTMKTTSFSHTEHESEWSPAVEVRLDAKYQVTRALALRFGWDIFWIDGIARSSNIIDYTLSENSEMGILTKNNRQDLLMQGWHIGFEVNR